jgi:hypothetical protein
MTFRVDQQGLRAFAELMFRNAEAAGGIKRFLSDRLEISEFEQVGGQGIPYWFTFSHDRLVARAQVRLTLLQDALDHTGFNVRDALADVRELDFANAAAMDATLDPWTHPPVLTVDRLPAGFRATMQFGDNAHPLDRLTATLGADVSDMEPKMSALDRFSGRLTDIASENWWLREMIIHVFGRDPVRDLCELFSGDWQVFARYAQVWAACGRAVADIDGNIHYSGDALGGVWEGNAADAAIAYLHRLADGVRAEIAFYDYLVATCKAYLDLAYLAYLEVDYVIGELIDLACTAFEFGVTVSVPFAGAAYQNFRLLVLVLAGIVDNVRAWCHGVQWMEAVGELPKEEPGCPLEHLVLAAHANVPDHRFQVPGR